MKLVLSFTLVLASVVLANTTTLKQPKTVRFSCQRDENGCWIALAQAVKEHPQAEHYEVIVRRDEGGTETTSEQGVWSSFTIYTWFYNKNTRIVDYSNWHQELNAWEGEQDRKRYDQITPQLLQGFLQLEDAKKRSFDSFAAQQGSRIVRYQKFVEPGIWDNDIKEKPQ